MTDLTTASATNLLIRNTNNNGDANDDPVITMMEDDAYLMSMVDTDSLLPSNMTFGGMFEVSGDNGQQLNAEELTDIASLLAPQVTDDETGESGGSVASSTGSNTPSSSGPDITTTTLDNQLGAPTLPKMISSSSSQNKRVAANASVKTPPTKKSKISPSSNKAKGKATGYKKVATTSAPKTSHKTTPNPLTKKTTLAVSSTNPKPAVATSSTTTTATATPGVVSATVHAIVTEATETASSKTNTTAPVVHEEGSSTTKTTVEKDRAQACRDRNRQHARNTRLRKKAYVEELKKSLLDLVEQRDATALEDRQKAKILEQQREVRFQVMQDFLQLRGRNEGNPHRWAAIFEEGMTLTLPMTHFQSMVPAASMSTSPTAQVLHGVTDIMADSTFFASFLQSLGDNNHDVTDDSAATSVGPVTFTYKCERANFLMDDVHAILNWTAQSSGAIRQGARQELELGGIARARFCAKTNRLEKIELQFDTGVVDSQVRQL